MSIEVKNLGFAFGDNQVLKGLDFTIPDKTLVNVLGHNGAGKTTLFKCLLGLYRNYTGTILVNGKDMRSLSVRQRAKEIAYIPQSHSSVFDYDVIDVVLMSAASDVGFVGQPKAEHKDRAYAALEKVGIANLAKRPYTQISGGEQQLTLIARAIAQNAKTIIMDEPTSALDYGNTVRVLSCVRELSSEGMSIIQSTHQPDHAFLYSDSVLVIHEGELYAYGDPKDVITRELVGTIYGVDVEVTSLYGDKVRVCVPVKELGKMDKKGTRWFHSGQLKPHDS